MSKEKGLVTVEAIQSRILIIRGEKVMLDRDLAELYGTETKQLKRAVRRNVGRFPPDFMFELTKEEYEGLRRQIGTLKRGEHSKYLPMAFTEQGVAMLSSALNVVFEAIRRLMAEPEILKKRIGFQAKERLSPSMVG